MLREFFEKNNKIALAFSGGTDSAYLLYAAKEYGADVHAYYIHSQFQPEFEYEDAMTLARDLDADITVIELDVLSDETIRSNPENRCYYCKNRIFSALIEQAKNDGYDVIIDGTNASDSYDDRPGMKALQEMKVLSPLRLCGITKDEVRKRSKEAGLFTWNKPAYACLATRIEAGGEIDAETLKKVEKSEAALMDMGFTDFRVRVRDGNALLQMSKAQMEKVQDEIDDIAMAVGFYFEKVTLDAVWR